MLRSACNAWACHQDVSQGDAIIKTCAVVTNGVVRCFAASHPLPHSPPFHTYAPQFPVSTSSDGWRPQAIRTASGFLACCLTSGTVLVRNGPTGPSPATR